MDLATFFDDDDAICKGFLKSNKESEGSCFGVSARVSVVLKSARVFQKQTLREILKRREKALGGRKLPYL